MTYQIGTHEFSSRLIVGTGKYPNFQVMKEALDATGSELITVALRRINLDAPKGEGLLDHIDRSKYRLLPNTAGCFTAEDAILTARLAREALETDLVKLEVIGDPRTLFPDNEATIEAAKVLIKDGFTVMPYVIDDPIICRKLIDLGCPTVMPLAAPIGSGQGIRTPTNLRIILETLDAPVIVDAGVGTASDAALAMELGCTAVLMNTAIAGADNPVQMAAAMRHGIEAGRLAYEAGRIPQRLYAQASSPGDGVVRIAGE
ncbi:MAG TPA: thiazole synthase [Deltaproteobacteria bacterium]|nr:thiazole synthase [Deltaproteobacteria bacterium]